MREEIRDLLRKFTSLIRSTGNTEITDEEWIECSLIQFEKFVHGKTVELSQGLIDARNTEKTRNEELVARLIKHGII